jgi:uncharacterized membrane protein
MNARVKKIVDEVMDLPPSERRLLRDMLDDAEDPLPPALLSEVLRRREAVRSGESKMLPLSEAAEMLERRERLK